MAEVLLQSHEMVAAGGNGTALVAVQTGTTGYVPLIRLLPTLPPAWAAAGGAGHVTGLRARGGFTLGIEWVAQGNLTQATVVSESGGSAYVVLGQTVIGATGGSALKVQGQGGKSAAVFLKLDTVVGGKYVVKLA